MSGRRYLAHYIPEDDGGAISASAAIGYELGIEASAEAVVVLAAALGFELGIEATVESGVDASATLGYEFGLAATAFTVVELAAELGYELGLDATVLTSADVAVELGYELGITITVEVEAELTLEQQLRALLADLPLFLSGPVAAAEVSAALGYELGIVVTVSASPMVAAEIGYEFGLEVPYTGPGTGVVVVGRRAQIADLLAGDEAGILLPFAGVAGMAGVGRQMSVTWLDEREQPVPELAFSPEPDAARVPALAAAQLPSRYTAPERASTTRTIGRTARRQDAERRRRRDR